MRRKAVFEAPASLAAVHYVPHDQARRVAVATKLDELTEALAAVEAVEGTKATSVRLPEPLHRAVALATELGMDESFTTATSRALTERVRAFSVALRLPSTSPPSPTTGRRWPR